MSEQHASIVNVQQSPRHTIQVLYMEVSDDGEQWRVIERITNRQKAWYEPHQAPDAPHYRFRYENEPDLHDVDSADVLDDARFHLDHAWTALRQLLPHSDDDIDAIDRLKLDELTRWLSRITDGVSENIDSLKSFIESRKRNGETAS